jgi:hypothetical protein
LNGSILCATLAEENFIQNIDNKRNEDEEVIEYVKMPKFYNTSEYTIYNYQQYLQHKAIPSAIKESTISSLLILPVDSLSGL